MDAPWDVDPSQPWHEASSPNPDGSCPHGPRALGSGQCEKCARWRTVMAWMAECITEETTEYEDEHDTMHRRTLEFARNAGAVEAMKVAQAEYGATRVKLTLAERQIVQLKHEVNSLSETLHVHLARIGPFVPPYSVEEEPLGGAGIPPRAARSCATCIASKTRCDQGQPCRLCRNRGVECVYTAPKKRGPKGKALSAFESEFYD